MNAHSSLSAPQLRHRRNLRGSLGFVEDDGFLRLTRDVLFESRSQAAGVLVGHSVNGAAGWMTTNGMTYTQWLASTSLRLGHTEEAT